MKSEENKNIDLVIPEPKKSLWGVKNIHSIEVFDSEKDILFYMKGFYQNREDYEHEKEVLIEKINDPFFSKMIERMNIIEPELFRYDYLEEFGNLTDVFVINNLKYSEDGTRIVNKNFRTISEDNPNIVMFSKDGISWKSCYEDLSKLYSFFRDCGVEFKKDINSAKVKKYMKKQ